MKTNKNKQKRGHSISLRSLEYERYLAKINRQSSQGKYSQDRDAIRVLHEYQNNSMTLDDKINHARESFINLLNKKSCDRSNDNIRSSRIGRQSSNNLVQK